MKSRLPIFLMILVLSHFTAMSAQATCSTAPGTPTQTEDGRAARIVFGNLNISSTAIQPPGTLISSVVVPPTAYTYGSPNASTVLWTCAAADVGKFYFLVATNGDDRVGGFYDIGGPDGLTNVYATWYTNVGLKLTMSNVELTKYWQTVPVTSWATSTTVGKEIQIRLQDIPPMIAQFYRVSSIPGTASVNQYCAGITTGSTPGMGSSGGYNCTQPSAYIQLGGTVVTTAHDQPGDNSASRFNFWGADNGFGYTLWSGGVLTRNASCVANNPTPTVLLPTATVQQLLNGQAGNSANFTIQITCDNGVASGTGSGQVALGFQPSYAAFNNAQSLGLTDASWGGSMKYLVSDNYGAAEVAKGVGVTLRNEGTGTDMRWVGQPGSTGSIPASQNNRDDMSYPAMTLPSGANAGWYPVLSGASATGTNAGTSSYLTNFSARIERLPGITPTAGKVYGTAYILVKVQ